jgi:hypothetical protein
LTRKHLDPRLQVVPLQLTVLKLHVVTLPHELGRAKQLSGYQRRACEVLDDKGDLKVVEEAEVVAEECFSTHLWPLASPLLLFLSKTKYPPLFQ